MIEKESNNAIENQIDKDKNTKKPFEINKDFKESKDPKLLDKNSYEYIANIIQPKKKEVLNPYT